MSKVGFRSGHLHDASRSNWMNDGVRPVLWEAWYPTTADPDESPVEQGTFFRCGLIYPEAAIARGQRFPVVVISHGTGGSAESLGWLAHALAMAGWVVIGVNHHGNTGAEAYRAEGFLAWWERALDISFLLDALPGIEDLGDAADTQRVSAIGYSLGGYTALVLCGAITRVDLFFDWAEQRGMQGPREFPDLIQHLPDLLETSTSFQASWARRSDDFSDLRVRRVVALAPAPTVRAFTSESLRAITQPVMLLSAGADTEAPPSDCSDWLARHIPHVQQMSIGQAAGHYVFLGRPVGRAAKMESQLFHDEPSVNRGDVHARILRRVISFLR